VVAYSFKRLYYRDKTKLIAGITTSAIEANTSNIGAKASITCTNISFNFSTELLNFS
jgi:hypothetical protein